MRRVGFLAGLAVLVGCAATPLGPPDGSRPFFFPSDVFAFENELLWSYEFAADGERASHARRQNVEMGQRCIAMARVTRQFFHHARFAPELPRAERDGYAELVGRVVETDPRQQGTPRERVVIPGYADLRAFSAARGDLVKERLGAAWRSYVQRGNWRMVFPFAPRQQRATAAELVADLERGELPIVRLVTFPRIEINHSVLVFGARPSATHIHFDAYDPNDNEKPAELVFERASATFTYEASNYFGGGEINVYEVYDGFLF